jgi:hypothetical protein
MKHRPRPPRKDRPLPVQQQRSDRAADRDTRKP